MKRHACASTGQQQTAVFAVNGGSGSGPSGSRPGASASPVAAATDPRLGPLPVTASRSRGSLHAPPIVGAAANLLGPKSMRPIKYKNSTPKDYGTKDSGAADEDSDSEPPVEKDELEGEAEDIAMSTSPAEAASKSSGDRAAGSGPEDGAEEEEDADAEGEEN